MNIQGKTALVTGASRGIGRAIALQLAKQGMQCILLVARDQQQLTQVADEITAMGVKAVVLPLDLTQPIEVNMTLVKVWRDYGPIHLLINCAGVAYQTSFLHTRLPDIQHELTVNLMGMYTITRLIARRMAIHKQGTIVNVSSLMGKVAAPTMATYSATKFAIVGFTQALRSELAAHNIRVIALLPSLTDTDMVKNLDWFRWIIPLSPEKVAQVLVDGLRQNQTEIVVGWQSHLAVWCHRIFPSWVERAVAWAAPRPSQKPMQTRLKNIWAMLW